MHRRSVHTVFVPPAVGNVLVTGACVLSVFLFPAEGAVLT